jgi:hypothetical protein
MNNISMPLYTPLMPNNTGRLVCKQHLNQNKVTVAMRPLSLPGDWPVISKWMNRDLSRSTTQPWQLPVKYLQETLSMMLQCDFAQPFMGIINGQPRFMIEICDGEKQLMEYETGYFTAESDDQHNNISNSH